MKGSPAGRHQIALVDLMVLVVAAAIGFGVFRSLTPSLDWQSPWPMILASPPGGWDPTKALFRALEIQVPLLPILFAWTIALPVLRLRRKGRPRRRLARQPGTAASLAALIGWAWASVPAAMLFAYDRATATVPPRSDGGLWLRTYFANMLAPMGMSVAIAWALLAAAGLWRPIPDVLDRLGRAMGAYWILVGLQWSGIFAYYWLI